MVGAASISQQLLELSTWLFFLWYFHKHVRAEVSAYDHAHRTPSDYALIIYGLPDGTTKEEVTQHFEQQIKDPCKGFSDADLQEEGCVKGLKPFSSHSVSVEGL